MLYLTILQTIIQVVVYGGLSFWVCKNWGPFIIVEQGETVVQERMGKFKRILTKGIWFAFPFVDTHKNINWSYERAEADVLHTDSYRRKIVDIETYRVPTKLHELEFCPTDTLSKDNHQINYSLALYFNIHDVKTAVYYKGDLYRDLQQMVEDKMEAFIGEMDCEEMRAELLTKKLNKYLQSLKWTDWGISRVSSSVYSLIMPLEVGEELKERRKLKGLSQLSENEAEYESRSFKREHSLIIESLRDYAQFAEDHKFTTTETSSFLKSTTKALIKASSDRNLHTQ